MKHKIVFICAVFLLSMKVLAQAPAMVFDGTKLSITVPSDRLELERDAIANEAIRDCFDWGGRDRCLFMANSEPYVFRPSGLNTDEEIIVPGIYNGEPVVIKVEVNIAPVTAPKVAVENKKGSNGTLLYIILAIVAVALMVLILFMRRKKKRDDDPDSSKYDPSVISIIKDESVKYEHGLGHVKEHLNEYLVFDMDSVYADTAVNKVYLNTTLVKKLYEFFSNSLEADGRTNETGCFIVGNWDFDGENRRRYDISLDYMVEPGDDADFGEYSLNFGKKISINMASVINNLAQKTNRDYVLTCWMHSHPGLGLFLSNQDLIVQKQLTYSDQRNRLLAIVIDTNTPELKTGFFTAKADGSMNNREDVKRWFSFEDIYREGREMNRNTPSMEENKEEECFGTNPDCFNVTLSGDNVDHIGFAPHAINQIDTTLYSCSKGVVGYFFGNESNRYLEVGCCLPYDNEEKLGCLIYAESLDASQLPNYAVDLDGSRFIAHCTPDDKVFVWVKSSKGSFEKVGEFTLTQMKEWIRRKRV